MPNHLTMTSPVYDTAAPKFGGGALSSGYGIVPGPLFVNNTALSYTLEAWVNSATSPTIDRVVIGQYRSAAIFVGASGFPKATYGNTSVVTLQSAVNVCDGNWHHLEMNVGPAGGQLFVDGVLVASSAVTWAASVPALGTGYYFGVRDYSTATPPTITSGALTFPGKIDEAAIWSGRLHTAAFTPNVAPYTGLETNLISLWHFNSSGVDSVGKFVAGAGTVTIAADAGNIEYSPENWVLGSGVAKSVNPGAYFKTSFLGNALTLNFTVGTSPYAQIIVRVDGRDCYKGPVSSAALAITMPTDTTGQDRHSLEVIVKAVSTTLDSWTTPVAALVFTGVTVQTNSVLTLPTVPLKKVLFFGDDVAQGLFALGKPVTITNDPDYHDGDVSFASQLRKATGAAVGMVTFNRQGFAVAGLNNVPALGTAYANKFNGNARSFAAIDLVIINQGLNDTVANGTTTAAVTTAVTTLITNLLAALPVTAKIVFLRPLNGNFWTNIQNGIINAGSKRVMIIEATNIYDVLESLDDIHPNAAQHINVLAPQLANQVLPILYGPPSASVVASVKDTDNVTLYRDGIETQVAASTLKQYLASVP